MMLSVLALLLGSSLAACKTQTPAANPEPKPAPAETKAPEPAPATQPAVDALKPDEFALPEDEAANPAEVLDAMRHNCCDEVPAAEVEANVREAAKRAKPN